MKRLINRDNISIEDAAKRIEVQKDLNFYINNADFTVSNSMDGLEDLEDNLINTLEQLLIEDEKRNGEQ